MLTLLRMRSMLLHRLYATTRNVTSIALEGFPTCIPQPFTFRSSAGLDASTHESESFAPITAIAPCNLANWSILAKVMSSEWRNSTMAMLLCGELLQGIYATQCSQAYQNKPAYSASIKSAPMQDRKTCR